MHNVALGLLLLVVVVAGALIGRAVAPHWGALVGTGAGLAVGVPLVVALHGRLSR